jgi:orotate phosphoribosyltransferase
MSQRNEVLVEDLASLGDAVTERAVEVEENGFDVVVGIHPAMLLRI